MIKRTPTMTNGIEITCIFAILFISLFSADAFNAEQTIWQQIFSFVMHLIPSFILLAFFIMAWKWEYLGGIIFIILGLGLSPFVFAQNYRMNESIWMSLGIVLVISIPFVIVGVLFIISHFIKKKIPLPNNQTS